MKIERIHIDGFGDFTDHDIGPLDHGLTVIYGPNEAGKTTLLSFLRHILFGFPNRNSRQNQYITEGSNRHGGTLYVRTDSGEKYSIGRQRGGPAIGTVNIRDESGTLIDPSELPRLLGHISRSLFEALFAFDLDELATFDIGDDAEISLYGTGSEASRLPKVLRAIEQTRESIFVARGRKQLVSGVLSDLETVQASLRSVHDQATKYQELNKDLERTTNSIQVLDENRESNEQHIRDIERLISAWAPWIELRDVRRQLDELPSQDNFPEEPISRLDTFEERLREEREIVADQKGRLDEARKKTASSIPDSVLLGRVSDIDTIRERRGAYIDSVRDLPQRESEAKSEEADLQDELRKLGGDWSSETVEGFDISITRSDEIDQWRGELTRLGLDRREKEQISTGIAAELLEAEQRLERLNPSSSLLPDAENHSVQKGRRQLIGALFFLILAALLAAIGIVTSTQVIVGLGAGSAIAGVWGLIRYLNPVTNPLSQSATVDSGEVTEARRSVDRLISRKSAAAEAVIVVIREAEEANQGWATWLNSSRLPASLTPEAASRFLSQIENVSRRIVAVNERLDRATAIQHDIDEYRSLVAPIAEEIGIAKAEDNHSVLGVSDQISSRYEEARQAIQERTADNISFSEREVDVSQAEGRLADVKTKYDELLDAGGTNDVEEFRRSAANHSKRVDLHNREQELVSVLHRSIGPDTTVDELDQKLTDTSLDSMNSELTDMNLELSDFNDRRDGLQNHSGELTNELSNLKGDEDASRLRMKRALLNDQLVEYADDWSRYSIARALLERTRQKYEEERQPAVLERASAYFSDLTDGRYDRVYQPIGNRGLQVIDDSTVEGEKAPEKLSRATKEQLYLSMRFAAIDEFGERQERLPVIVDEILVNFDPVRAGKAAEAFRRISENNQVIVFTCHPWIRDLFQKAIPDAALIELE